MTCKKCARAIPEASAYCMFCGASQAPRERSVKKRGNGQGTVYKRRNGKYIAERVLGYYMDEDGKRRRKTVSRVFTKKSDAVAALPSLIASAEREKDISLHDLYAQYIKTADYGQLSKSQQNKMTYAWNRWKDWEFRGIGTITIADIENRIDDQTESYYPAHDMKVLLSHLYTLAIKQEYLSANKTEHVELSYATPKAKRESWTQQEIDALWKDYETHPFTGYILIMCYAGLRYGELSLIKLADIHTDDSYMVGGIKTEAGIDREIPIHDRIKPVIRQLMQDRRTKLLEMNEDTFYAAYWETIHRAGLRELPPHTCRHYFFSRMTAEGIQGGIIAEVGGHANYLTTLKNYVRIPLADKLRAVNSI